jgi:hypothetical protein
LETYLPPKSLILALGGIKRIYPNTQIRNSCELPLLMNSKMGNTIEAMKNFNCNVKFKNGTGFITIERIKKGNNYFES